MVVKDVEGDTMQIEDAIARVKLAAEHSSAKGLRGQRIIDDVVKKGSEVSSGREDEQQRTHRSDAADVMQVQRIHD